MKARRSTLCSLFFLLFGIANSADYQVSVTTISVWVKATNRAGQPVEGLTQEDFEVYEDNQKLPITCFEETKLEIPAGQAGEEAAPEIPAKRFVVFLDLYNTSQAEYLYIKPKLDQFLDGVLSKGREVMIAAILANRKMGVVVPFSTDASRIRGVLAQAQGNSLRDAAVKSNEDELSRVLRGLAVGRSTGSDRLRDGFQLADQFSKADREVSTFTLKALENFAGYLTSLKMDQHAVVLFVSGGFSADPGRRYFDLVDKAAEDLRESLEDPELAVYHRGTSLDLRKEVQKSIGRLNRLNVTLYTINTRGLFVSDIEISREQKLPQGSKDFTTAREYQDSLAEIANETGGTSFYNSQNFKLGFNQVLQDLNHQYLLCYVAPAHKKSGEYHEIKVACKRPGVELRHRQGYLD